MSSAPDPAEATRAALVERIALMMGQMWIDAKGHDGKSAVASAEEFASVSPEDFTVCCAIAEATIALVDDAAHAETVRLRARVAELCDPANAERHVTPEAMGAAWTAWHARHGGKLGPGPAFREALSAGLAVILADFALTDPKGVRHVG